MVTIMMLSVNAGPAWQPDSESDRDSTLGPGRDPSLFQVNSLRAMPGQLFKFQVESKSLQVHLRPGRPQTPLRFRLTVALRLAAGSLAVPKL